jgi:hypothetical protein
MTLLWVAVVVGIVWGAIVLQRSNRLVTSKTAAYSPTW